MAPAPPPSPAPDFYPKDSICISCRGGGEAGGSGAGPAAGSLDPFSVAAAGSSGGTKSPGASFARPRTELAAGAVISPAQSSIPTSFAFFPPSLLLPSLLFLLLPQPRSAPSRSWAWHGHPLLPPCAQQPAVPCRAAPCSAAEEKQSGAGDPSSAAAGGCAGGRAALMPGGRSPAPAWEHPAGTSARRHRRPLGLKYSALRAAPGEGQQVSAGCT